MIEQIYIVLENFLSHLPLLLGAYISFSLLKAPDLSIESAYVCGAIMASTTLPFIQEYPLFLQLTVVAVASMFGGGLVGLTSSILTCKAGFSHLLSCIITFGIFFGFNQWLSASYISLSLYTNPLISSFITRYPEIIIVGAVTILVLLLIHVIFCAQLGYAFSVYGNNSQFFNHYGINSTYVFMMGITLSNMLAGLSGYFFAQMNGFAEVNMAFGKSLLCITALILGKTFVPSQKPLNILIPLVGLCAYFVLQQLLLCAGFNLKYFAIMQSLVVLILLIVFKNNKSFDSNNLGI